MFSFFFSAEQVSCSAFLSLDTILLLIQSQKALMVSVGDLAT